MLTNAEIVIFNQFPDREKKRMIYVPHKVPKVWLYKDQKVTVGEHGLKSAELYKIRIPWPVEGWLPEQDFRDLAEPGEAWTVQNGDFFLKGDWDGGERCRNRRDPKALFRRGRRGAEPFGKLL